MHFEDKSEETFARETVVSFAVSASGKCSDELRSRHICILIFILLSYNIIQLFVIFALPSLFS